MRKYWPMTWCLTGIAGLLGIAGPVMGQAAFEAPQYPQYVQYPQGAPPVTPGVPGAQIALTADQIDQLLALVALYPDPLLSLIFPASTYPQDVVAANQWLAATPNPTEADIAAQSWDASIKGLVHYPTVLNMMGTQIDWTQAVGAAFTNQQQDVLASVQRLRARAQAAHNLQTTAQEQVLADNGAIRIEPVDPNLMYVPQYDPNVVYDSAYPISFGIGYPIGLWCDNDFDWNRRSIDIGGGWYRGWHHPAEWDRHPPAWDRHPAGWVATPRTWVRTPSRPAPRLTPPVVARLGLDRQRGAAGVNPIPGLSHRLPAPLPIGRGPAPLPARNIFEPANSRAEVQRALQRAHPAPVIRPSLAPINGAINARAYRPAAPIRPAMASTPRPARAAPAPRMQFAAPPRSAPNNVFRGGSGGATRAQSARGHASGHR